MRITTLLAFVTSTTIALIHSLAMAFELYWRYSWLDIPMHIFGGVLFVLLWGVLIDVGLVTVTSLRKKRLAMLGGIVLVSWEVFGVILEQGFKENFLADTTMDILCGVVGIIIGYFIVRSLQITKL